MDQHNVIASDGVMESVKRPFEPSVREVVLWCEQVSVHYASWLRALAEMNVCSVTVIASTPITPERERLGWTSPRISPAKIVIANSLKRLYDALAACDANAVHVVEGIRGTWIARESLRLLVASGRRIGIMSEACDGRGMLGVARRALYGVHLWRFREKIDFVIAMGEVGVRWYASCGFPRRRLFPFMYTAESPIPSVRPTRTGTCDRSVRVVYVGRCVYGKGVHDLVEALSQLHDDSVSLTVIGDGEQRTALEATVSRSRALRGRVSFTGVLPYHEAVASISGFDLLVLPSHCDGWGVVVNEALMQGVPVVCSDMCGSKDLLSEPWRGGVFRSGCTRSLAAELSARVHAGPIPDKQRERLRTWSRRLHGDRMAEYFVSILAHVYSGGSRPEPPWST
jgi:glycosyltransferase involved in cell wall biosynthesis